MIYNHQKRTQESICELIRFQRMVLLSGGVLEFSDLHLELLWREQQVLGQFGLPDSHFNRLHLYIYPFSCAQLRRKLFVERQAFDWGFSDS